MVSLDTETTGVDLRHDAAPYLVTACRPDGAQRWWEWDVDPLTRKPVIPESDLEEICALVERVRRWNTFTDDVRERNALVFQNPKFDVTALARIGVNNWPWEMTRDTLLAGHLLHSGQPHDLTSMAMLYLGVDIQPYEDRLEEACKEARRLVRSKLPDWKIAKEGLDGMPSAKGSSSDKRAKGAESGSTWKFDAWLPRAICKWADKQPHELTRSKSKPWWSAYSDPEHPWRMVCSSYANIDSSVTVALWPVLKSELEKKGLWDLYLDRLKLLPVIWEMEERGVTYSARRLRELRSRYDAESHSAGAECVKIAARYGHELTLPRSGNNKSLLSFAFDKDKLALPVVTWTEGGNPAFNKEAMEHYDNTLPDGSDAQKFIRTLQGKRRRDTALNYLAGYERFSKPLPERGDVRKVVNRSRRDGSLHEWRLLHPNINPTGTDTLRSSSNNPNSQNVSKKDGFNLRYCFGPAPGREWWTFDGENMELRVAAYESGEEEFIALFERQNEPPYFGSNHLLMAHLVFPHEFESCLDDTGNLDGRIFKSRYSATLYDRTKRGNFARQYGAQRRKVDVTFGVQGADDLIRARFFKQDALNQKWMDFAEKRGYVETLPERDVDPRRGFPVMCQRTSYGRIEPTKPFSYHIQSTVSRWMEKSMVRVHEQLKAWYDADEFDGFITLAVHDELALDLPKKADPFKNLKGSNLWRARQIARIMEDVGRDFVVPGRDDGIPIRVSMSYHPETYSDGLAFKTGTSGTSKITGRKH